MRLRTVPFVDVFEDLSGGNSKVPKGELLKTGRLPVVDQGQELLAGYTNDESRRCKVKLPAVVFGDHTRAIKYIDFPFAMGADGTKVLKTRNGVDTKYAFHALSALEIPSAGYSRHFKFLKRMEIPLPPLDEQKRIARILDQADALRAKRRETIKQLDSLVKSVFLDMFGKTTCSMRIGELLRQGLLFLHKDGNHGSRYPRAEDFGDDGVPFLSAKCISDSGNLIPGEVQFLRKSKAQELKIGWIEKGDVLLAHNASVGKTYQYDGRFDAALIGTSVTAFRPDPDRLDSTYLYGALRSQSFQQQLFSNMAQTTRNQVPITAQRRLSIPIPSIAHQREFAMIVNSLRRTMASLRDHLADTDHLFSSLQQRAFKGEL